MSTPSPVPLDNFDPVSPYAPPWARDQVPEPPTAQPPLEPQHPAGIETAHDARILDEIEASLRAMIEANHGGDAPARLSDVSRIAAEQLAEQPADESLADEPQTGPASAEQHRGDMHADHAASPAPKAEAGYLKSVFRDPRTPPWLLPRSLEPEPVPEPWPNPRKHSRANKLFLRFGLAATGAAVVAAVAIKDVPSALMEYVRGPLTDLSTNAAAVFNDGKAPTLQARMDAVKKELDRLPEPTLRYAVASADPQARSVPVKTETIARAPEPRRETVMTPWPSPEAAKRRESADWQSPPAPSQMQTTAPVAASTPARTTSAAPARLLNGEEIAMLRKMGDDYIAAGDFAGARAVLERAADAGDAGAAFAIASTYDPVVLVRFKVRGLEPDIIKAGFWYERARELGSAEAPHRLQAMMSARGN